MFQGLNVFKIAHAMATHAGQRQAVIAQNVANADTPGYAAQDIQPFSRGYQQGLTDGMRASRTTHLTDYQSLNKKLLSDFFRSSPKRLSDAYFTSTLCY